MISPACTPNESWNARPNQTSDAQSPRTKSARRERRQPRPDPPCKPSAPAPPSASPWDVLFQVVLHVEFLALFVRVEHADSDHRFPLVWNRNGSVAESDGGSVQRQRSLLRARGPAARLAHRSVAKTGAAAWARGASARPDGPACRNLYFAPVRTADTARRIPPCAGRDPLSPGSTPRRWKSSARRHGSTPFARSGRSSSMASSSR